MKGLRVFGLLSDQPDRLSDQGSEGTPSAGYTIGWYGKLWPRVAAGLSCRSKSYVERVKNYAGPLPDRGRLEFPATYGGGLAWMSRDDLSFSAELLWIEFESVRAFGNGIEKLIAGNPLASRNGLGFDWQNMSVVNDEWQATQRLGLRSGMPLAPRTNTPSNQTGAILRREALHRWNELCDIQTVGAQPLCRLLAESQARWQ